MITYPIYLNFLVNIYLHTHIYMHVYTEQLTCSDLRTRKHNAFLKGCIVDLTGTILQN